MRIATCNKFQSNRFFRIYEMRLHSVNIWSSVYRYLLGLFCIAADLSSEFWDLSLWDLNCELRWVVVSSLTEFRRSKVVPNFVVTSSCLPSLPLPVIPVQVLRKYSVSSLCRKTSFAIASCDQFSKLLLVLVYMGQLFDCSSVLFILRLEPWWSFAQSR